MASASNSIVIDRPLDAVYRFLADGLNNPRWRAMVSDISLVSGPAGATGAVYQQSIKGPMGRKIAGDYRIVSAVPNSSIRFEVIAGPARPAGSFELAPANGGTRVAFTLSFQPRGLMRLMNRMIQSSMNAEVHNLTRLKQVMEGEATG